MLAIIAQSVPFKPVMDKLSNTVGTSRNVLPDYFLYMEKAGMIGQMRVNHEVISSRISDFEIDGMTFEVGGRNKGKRQIADASQGYIVRDDIEFAAGNIIPLWTFGLNY